MNMQKYKSFADNQDSSTEAHGPRRRKTGSKTDNAEIEQLANHKHLGTIINEDLTYEVHVDKLLNILLKWLGLLCHISGVHLKRSEIWSDIKVAPWNIYEHHTHVIERDLAKET